MNEVNLGEKHPVLYDMAQPNFLVSLFTGTAKKGTQQRQKTPLTVSEHKLLTCAIHAHYASVSENTTGYFDIPYSRIFSEASLSSSNKKVMVERIAESLHSKVLIMDKNAAQLLYQDTKLQGATFNIFYEVRYYSSYFRVSLHPKYTEALGMLRTLGFTKGDFATLMTFNHQWSFPFYWRARQWQQRSKTIQVPLDELRSVMYLDGAYKEWRDLDRQVLKVLQEKEFSYTWTSFSYKPVKENRKVVAVELTFDKGPGDERDLPIGMGYKWETTMDGYGMMKNCIRKIRHFVKCGETHTMGFAWDDEYVRLSMEGFRRELVRKQAKSGAAKVNKPGAYLYIGLMKGYWISFVSEERARKQTELFQQGPVLLPAQAQSDIDIHMDSDIKNEPKQIEDPQDVIDSWMSLYKDIVRENKKLYPTFEKFMVSMGHRFNEGVWEKI
ncbi:MAG: replication initiation protein [Cytophagales bacterium]|nr:replication initiation protein [Cytophagales bacterium]